MTEGPAALETIRRDIDEIDGKLLDLLAARFAATERVKAAKASGAAPMRPAREAEILRRICASQAPGVPLDLRRAIWRAIISTSTLAQAPVRVHAASALAGNPAMREAIRDHFGPTPIETHASDDAALATVAGTPGDVAVAALDGSWSAALVESRVPVTVSGVLPFLARAAMPSAVILSHAAAEPTGADQTLVATNGALPRGFAPPPLWELQAGRVRLSCLPGFLDEHSQPLIGLTRADGALGLNVLGRYPSPITVPA